MNLDAYIPYFFAIVLALPFLFYMRQFIHFYVKMKDKEMKLLSVKNNSELKLQALERMTLFLERLKPSNLVTKFDKNLATHEFIYLTEKAIQEEFEYNSSQQLYINSENWQDIVSVKNSILQNLRKTYEELNDTNLQDFKTIFLMNYVKGEDYISQTIDRLRKEAVFA